MDKNNFPVRINGKPIIIPAWSTFDDTQNIQSSSNLTGRLKAVIDEKKKYVKIQDDTRKLSGLIKISKRVRTSVLVIITIIALGILIQQGSICISK